MMVHVELHRSLKAGPCTKYAETDNKIENIMVNPHK